MSAPIVSELNFNAVAEYAAERSPDALDYSRFAFDPLAVGYGQLVYAGRIYSHSPGSGSGCSLDSANSRPKPGGIVSQEFGSTQFALEEFQPQTILRRKHVIPTKIYRRNSVRLRLSTYSLLNVGSEQ